MHLYNMTILLNIQQMLNGSPKDSKLSKQHTVEMGGGGGRDPWNISEILKFAQFRGGSALSTYKNSNLIYLLNSRARTRHYLIKTNKYCETVDSYVSQIRIVLCFMDDCIRLSEFWDPVAYWLYILILFWAHPAIILQCLKWSCKNCLQNLILVK